MAYRRTTWLESETPLSAENMNNIEDGIAEAMQKADGNPDMWEFVRNLVYPIGSIYMSATLDTKEKVEAALGGTWVAWGKGKVPVGVDAANSEFNTVEKEGGSPDASVVEHNHTASFTGNAVGNHTHTGPSHTHTGPSHSHGIGSTSTSAFVALSGTTKGIGEEYVPTYAEGPKGARYDFVMATNQQFPYVNDDEVDFQRIPTTKAAGTEATGPAGTGNTGGGGAHTPSGSVTVNNNGDAGTNKNLQPYITCYMWKRTA